MRTEVKKGALADFFAYVKKALTFTSPDTRKLREYVYTKSQEHERLAHLLAEGDRDRERKLLKVFAQSLNREVNPFRLD